MREVPLVDYGHIRLADFELEPGKVHLNHGSFGAVPRAITEAQAQWRRRIEGNPTGFFRAEMPGLLRSAADRVAAAYGGQGADWVFVDNATSGANAVIGNLTLEKGDQLLTTGEVYNAVRQALRHHAKGKDVEVIEAPVTVPLADAGEVVESVRLHLGPRTRALFIDHVTSRSGLILPVAEIAALAREAGVPVFVDGAHAPAMIDLDVAALGVDWYVGNGHKWLCAPRNCAFLWCAPARQAELHPVVISHGYGQGIAAEFGWVGTRDPSAWLTVTAALDWHEEMGGAALRARNHELALAMGRQLSEALDSETSGPDAVTAAMATVRLPEARFPGEAARALSIALEREHDMVVSVNEIGGRAWLRVSAAIYNELGDCDGLPDALARCARSD